MTEETPVQPDNMDGRSSVAARGCRAMPQTIPTLSIATTRLSLVAAADQFAALTRFVSEKVGFASVSDVVRMAPFRRVRFERAFFKDGVINLDGNGAMREIVQYSLASEAIRAKAVALGYQAQVQTVEITAVPGGYVGRFSGNDIYAATR